MVVGFLQGGFSLKIHVPINLSVKNTSTVIVDFRLYEIVYKNSWRWRVFLYVIADCVRSTREGYVLTHVCPFICLSIWGGGPGQVRWGRGGTRGRVSSPPPPPAGHQMEYLIRRGLYASCVHAGGLSCSLWFHCHYFLHCSLSTISVWI